MDVLKSLPPLFIALNPQSSNSLTKLRARREALSEKVTDVINTLGPEVIPDFDAERIIADPFREGAYQSRYRRMPDTPKNEEATEPSTPTSAGFDKGERASQFEKSFGLLPRNESFRDIGGFGFFASRPQTPKSHSRSSSAGGALNSGGLSIKAFSSLNTNEGFDEVSRRIRGAMKERGRKRESEGENTEASWDMADSDEEAKKER